MFWKILIRLTILLQASKRSSSGEHGGSVVSIKLIKFKVDFNELVRSTIRLVINKNLPISIVDDNNFKYFGGEMFNQFGLTLNRVLIKSLIEYTTGMCNIFYV